MRHRVNLGPASRDFLSISRHSLNYFIGQILTKSLGFLLIPLYTRFLAPEDYGILAMVGSMVGVATAAYTLGLRGSFSRFYWDYKGDRKELGELFATILAFVTLTSLIATGLLLVFGKGFFATVMKDVPFTPYIQTGLLLAFLGVYSPFWTTLCRVREKSFTYSVFTTAQFLFATGLSIYFVVYLREGAWGRLKGQLYSQIAFASIAIFLLGREIVLHVSWNKLRQALKYGVPLVPHNLSAWVISLFDRFVLGGYHGLVTVGVYNVGYALGGIMGIVAVAFNLSYSPYFMKTLTEKGEQAKITLARVATLWIAGMAFIAIMLSVFSREIVYLMTPPAYHAAWKIVPVVALAFFFQGMYFMSVAALFYNKKFTRYVPIASFIGGGVNILGNFLFTPHYGMMGAAWATVASYLSLFLIALFFAREAFSIPYEYSKILRVMVISIFIFGISYTAVYFLGIGWVGDVVMKMLIVSAYFPLLLLGKVFDMRRVKQLITGTFSPGGRE